MPAPDIQPRLVVDDVGAAIDFYVTALGGTEELRFADPSGKVVHAEVRIGSDVISLTERDGELSVSPTDLGGTPLLLTITVDDAYSVGAAMEAAGATIVIPIEDRIYGRREGRLRDVAGHLWIVSQLIEDLTTEEITGRLAGR